MEAKTLLSMIDGLADLPYGLEPVDQRTHAFQTAGLALAEQQLDDELVTAALVHDIGRHPEVTAESPNLPHEEAARRWCDRYFAPRVGWLVGAHVSAKRYLTATDPNYMAGLSEESVMSLRVQGGPMSPDEVAVFEAVDGFEDAVRLRRWDDLAKVPDGPLPDREIVLGSVERALAWR